MRIILHLYGCTKAKWRVHIFTHLSIIIISFEVRFVDLLLCPSVLFSKQQRTVELFLTVAYVIHTSAPCPPMSIVSSGGGHGR